MSSHKANLIIENMKQRFDEAEQHIAKQFDESAQRQQAFVRQINIAYDPKRRYDYALK
jgi:hypothetical protein